MNARVATKAAASLCFAVVVARIALAFLTAAPAMSPDGLGYDDAARRWVQYGHYAWVYPGDVVDDPPPNAMHLPGYPAFLAALYGLAGGQPPTWPLVATAQAILSGLTLWAIFLVCSRLSDSRTGLLACLMGSIYVPFWFSYRHVLTEDLFAALCVWATYWLIIAMEEMPERRLHASLIVGALMGAATYVRAAAAAWALLVGVLLVVFAAENRVRYARRGFAAAFVMIAFLTPWWLRNATIYGRFVPLNTMSAAGSLVSTFEDRDDLERLLESVDRGHLVPVEEIAYNQEIADIAQSRARGQIRDDPARFVWLKARAVGVSVFTYHPNPFNGFRGWGAVVEIIHLVILAFAARAIWFGRANLRIWVIASLPIVLILLHAATLIYSRYLYPMMPSVIVLAALGVSSRGMLHISRDADGE